MKEKNQWIPFQELEWDDKKFNLFNIDTRDFHAGYQKVDDHKDFKKLSKYPNMFLTEQEVKDLLNRYYKESGGESKWRCFCLKSSDDRVINWNAKYLRIYRTEKGFLVCNSYQVAIPKEILKCDVDIEVL